MGMAASQARYLGLTARKTNVEYEGQQVNQQRTALANESAGLFRRLLALEVPTAPSQTDYYKDVYQYSDASTSDGKVTVSNIQANDGSDPQTYTVDIKYNMDTKQFGCSPNQNVTTFTSDSKSKIQLENGNIFDLTEVSGGISQSTVDEFNKLGTSVGYTNETTDKYYSFYNSSNKSTFYINATKTGFDPTVATTQKVDFFSSIQTTEEKQEQIKNATLGKSAGGIYNAMYWTDDTGTPHNVSLTSAQEYDEQGYNDAMDKYNVNKQNYEKEITDINAKTEQLQQTDRTLELRLKQLDTEQEALQTELDSVKKVIDKNVDNVFKTFQ